jgi:hypothetical protein
MHFAEYSERLYEITLEKLTEKHKEHGFFFIYEWNDTYAIQERKEFLEK